MKFATLALTALVGLLSSCDDNSGSARPEDQGDVGNPYAKSGRRPKEARVNSKSDTERDPQHTMLRFWKTNQEVARVLDLEGLTLRPRAFADRSPLLDPPSERELELEPHFFADLEPTHGLHLGFNRDRKLVLIVREERASDVSELEPSGVNDSAIRTRLKFWMTYDEVTAVIPHLQEAPSPVARDYDPEGPTAEELQYNDFYVLLLQEEHGLFLGFNFNKELVHISQVMKPPK